MTFHYAAYGLTIASAIELPELGPQWEAASRFDVNIILGEVSRIDTEGGGGRGGSYWIDPQHFWLHVDTVAYFLVSEGHTITIMADADADPSTVRAYLLGSVCGAMLVQRGFLILHGNAIRIGDACLVCVGDSGAGKSTLAAAFLQRGYPVLADDVVAVDNRGCAIPGFPRIKLWQDAADQLGYSTEGQVPVVPGMAKFNLLIQAFDPDERLPIRWIYRLGSADTDDVRVEEIGGMARFRLLRDNTYRHEYLEGHSMFADHLAQCGQLANQARMASVQRPADGFAIDLLIDSLLADVASYGRKAA
jgi:hypothetical protein